MNKKRNPVLLWLNDHLEETLLIILLLAITLLTGLQVVMRRVIGSPLSWSEELCRYCFMWSGFIGVAYCIRKRCEIRITTVTEFLPKALQAVFMVASDLVCAVVYGAFSYVTVKIISKAMASGQISPAIGIPNSLIYLGALLGFGLSFIRLCQNIVEDVRSVYSAAPVPTPEAKIVEPEPQV